MVGRALVGVLVALPWVNPFVAGPSPSVVPLVTSALALAALLLLARFLDVSNVVWAWLIAAVVSAVMGLLQYVGVDTLFAPWVNHAGLGQAFGNLRQRNQFGTLMAIGLGALWWQQMGAGRDSTNSVGPAGTIAATDKWGNRLAIATVVVLATASAASGSRTGLTAWALVTLLALRWSFGSSRLMARHVLIVGAFGYVLAAWLLPMSIGQHPLHHGLLSRLDPLGQGCFNRSTLWSNVLYLISLRPWLGWGVGELDYAHYATLYPGERFCDILDNAHNLPLHLAVELGVPVALGTCAAIGLWVFRRKPWAEQDVSRQLAWLVLLAIGWHSLLEYPLWYGPFQMALGLALWMLMRGRSISVDSHSDATSPILFSTTRWSIAATIRVTVAALTMAFSAYAAWDYRRVSQIYLNPEDRAPAYSEDTLARTRSNWLFTNQWEFAALTIGDLTPTNANAVFERAQRLLHYSPEARVIERVIESAELLGRFDDAAWHEERYRVAFPKAHTQWLARKSKEHGRMANVSK